MIPNFHGDFAGGAVTGLVLTSDFHLKNVIGLSPGTYVSVSEQSDQTTLEGAETAFDFAFGLRRGSDEVNDV